MRLGLLMRNGSIQFPEAISHDSKNPPIMVTRRNATHTPRFKKRPLAGAAASEASGLVCSWLMSRAIVSMLMLDVELVAENIPQSAVGFVESLLPVNFKDIARPAHGDIDNVFDLAGTVRHHYDPVSQRDRFYQIMSHEDNGLRSEERRVGKECRAGRLAEN